MSDKLESCVIWRTGNPDAFKWHRSAAMSEGAALSAKAALERDGYRAMTERYSRSVAIGLPSTWAANQWEINEDRKRLKMSAE